MEYDENLSDKEIELLIRQVLRKEFPDTAFRVSLVGDDFTLDIIGGELMKYGDNLPVWLEDKIQNVIFEVYPIIIYFDESEYV